MIFQMTSSTFSQVLQRQQISRSKTSRLNPVLFPGLKATPTISPSRPRMKSLAGQSRLWILSPFRLPVTSLLLLSLSILVACAKSTGTQRVMSGLSSSKAKAVRHCFLHLTLPQHLTTALVMLRTSLSQTATISRTLATKIWCSWRCFKQANSLVRDFYVDHSLLITCLITHELLDMALGQWIASTPKQIVKDTLNLSNSTLSKLKTEKQYVVAGSTSS